jgi:flagellar motor protein MotB
MSVSETVDRQSASYRRGLVLGLTMAEVILLIVFALLIALAAVWKAEHTQRTQLESALNALETTASLGAADPTELVLLAKMRVLLHSPKGREIAAALQDIVAGQEPLAVTEEEKNAIVEIRAQLRNVKPAKIDEQWRSLVAASKVADLPGRLQVVEAVEKFAPKGSGTNAMIEVAQRLLGQGEHSWPPIINLSEAGGYFFATGKAELTENFERQLKNVIVPELITLAERYRVDIIEVIGHTDERPVSLRTTNLDSGLLDALKSSGSVSSLVAADNAGLGLSRAVSVASVLIRDGRLARYRVLPYSGGQLIGTDEKLTSGGGGDAQERRRIEIRLRRSQESMAKR